MLFKHIPLYYFSTTELYQYLPMLEKIYCPIKYYRFVWLITLFLLSSLTAQSQALSGTYVIDNTLTTGGTNFASFSDAVTRLDTSGISGAVTFNVAAGQTFPEQIDIPAITGSSSSNTVTFNGNGSTLTYTGSATSGGDRYTLRLSGADYFTFNNLIVSTTGSTYGTAVHIYNASDYNTFDTCTISASTSSSSTSVNAVIISGHASSTGGTAAQGDSITFSNSIIRGGNYAFSGAGSSSDSINGLTLTKNTFEDARSSALRFAYVVGLIASQNDISNPNRTTFNTSAVGITLANYMGGALVEKNYIHDLLAANTSGTNTITGINMFAAGSSGQEISIKNNVIGNFNSLGIEQAISISNNGAYTNIQHNTIDLSNTQATTNSSYSTYGIYMAGSANNFNIRNNIISVTRNSIGTIYGFYYLATTNITSDYNNVYVKGMGTGVDYLGRYLTTSYPTLAQWQAISGGPFDQSSTDLNPVYTNTGSGNFTPSNGFINNTGTALGVTDDFLSTSRSLTTPDVGAYEWACTTMAGTYTIDPAQPVSSTNFQTFQGAVNALSCGISAPVIFNVAAGNTFNEQIDIPEIVGTSPTNTVTFNGHGDTLTHAGTSISSTTDRHTLRLSGADYFRFNNLNILTSGTVYATAVHMYNASNHNTFDSCTIGAPITSTSSLVNAMVLANNEYSVGPSGAFAVNDSTTIQNCTLQGGHYNLFIGTLDTIQKLSITDCQFEDARDRNMNFRNIENLTLQDCEISNSNRTNIAGHVYGIYLFGYLPNALVEKNYIHELNKGNPSATGNIYGIISNALAANGSEMVIRNNVIGDIDNSGTHYGIFFGGGATYTNVVHNTIDLSGTTSVSSIGYRTYGIYCPGSNVGVLVKNNNIHVTRNAQGDKHGVYITSANVISDYNNIYVNGPVGTNNVGTTGGSLAGWQSYLAGSFDQNSTSYDPGFVNPALGNFTPTNGFINNTGDTLMVADDILGVSRSTTTPDVGAYEWSCSPISGVYTVDPSQPISATNVQTFQQAVNILSCGITGPVTFNMAAGYSFNEQIDIPEIAGTSSTNTVTFNGNGDTLTYLATTSAERHTLRLRGADYFIFNDLNFEASGAAYGHAVHLYDAADYNVFRNCKMWVDVANPSGNLFPVAICCHPSLPTETTQGVALGCNNNIIDSCTVEGGFYSMTIVGENTAPTSKNTVSNSSILEDVRKGIFVAYQDSLVIQNTEFARPTRSSISDYTGVQLSTNVTNALIEKNHFHNPAGGNTSTTTLQIGVLVEADATSGNENRIINNLFEDFNSAGGQYGIQLSGSDYCLVYHNTIDLSSTLTYTGDAIGIYHSSVSTGADIRNNNIRIAKANGIKRGLYISPGTTVCDYNNVYVNGAAGANYYGQYSISTATNLSNWQTVSGGLGQNSTEQDPLFVNPAGNDYTPSNGFIDNTGIGLGVTDDIKNIARSATTPDVGAYEWVCSPINGTYTIDPTSAISATNVQTFQQAVDLLSCGIDGPVIFNVVGTPTFNEQIEIFEITGSSAVNTVTFNGNGSTLTHNGSAPTSRHTLRLSGTDYFRFNRLNINATGTTYGHAVHLYNNADHNIFDSCGIALDAFAISSNISGFVISSDPNLIIITGAFSGCDSNQLTNSTITGGRRGVALYGKTSGRPNGNIIRNNTISDFYEYGIRMTNTNNTTVQANNIHKLNRTDGSTFYGIRSGSDLNVLVDKNHIHHPFGTTTFSSSACNGIYFAGSVASGNDNYVTNNLIEDFNNLGDHFGIHIASSSQRTKFYHNTIDLSGSLFDIFSQTMGIYSAGNNVGTEIRNNIVTISRGGTQEKHGIVIGLGSNVISNNNNVFLNAAGTLNYYGRYGNVNYQTLANWQTANGAAYGLNSYNLDPQYVSPATNDYNPSNLTMDNIGAPLGITDDIENVTRSTTAPDAGAYEFACTGLSTIVTNYVSVTDTTISCNGAADGEVTVQSSLGNAPYTYVLTPGSVTNTSGHFNNLDTGAYRIVVYDAHSCTDTVLFNVTQPDVLVIDSIVQVSATCNPSNDGVMTIYASGGTTAYSYDIGGSGQSSNIFNGLSASNYTVTVTDANSCTASSLVSFLPPPTPTITFFADTNISCNGLANGSVQINVVGTGLVSYTLNPGSISNTTGYFNNLSPNTYTVTATDAKNCTVSSLITITQPLVLNIDSLTSALPTCIPGNDGNILVHTSGGTTPYLYNVGGSNQSSNSFTSLASNIYLVTVTDSNACMDTMSIDLSAPLPPVITSTLDTNVSCNGLNNGSIQVAGTGSSALTYTLNPGSITNTSGYFNNLSPNTYTITLSDASSCTISTTVTITEPLVLNIDSLTSALPTCIPGNDGSIVVHASGGTTPYLYNVGGPNQSSNSFTSLASNIYLVTVTDSNACMDTMSIDLNAPLPPVITSTLDTNVSCNGLNNGSIQIVGTGSTALTYTLNPGSVTNTSGYFNNLSPNTYTITLSDASSCTISTTVVITEPLVLNIDSLTSALPTCIPGNDGSILVHTSGGTSPYLYNVGGSNQSSNNFSSLASGIYLVTVTDSNACTDTMSIDLSAPSAPVITSLVDTNVNCNGLNNGSIQIAGTGSTALTYTLNPGSITNTSGYFNNLSPNTYTITLSDASNCTVSTTVTITEPPVLNIDSLTHTLPTCIPGNDGSIVVHASGGTTPYLYNVGGPNQSSNSFSGLASNIYLVTVTDSNACMDTMSIDLSAPLPPVITSTLDTNVSCNGLNNGSIQIAGTGSSSLTYTLNPGSITNTSGYFNNLNPNTYTITLSDASNCTISTTVAITEPLVLNIDSLTSTLPTCLPGNDGSIVVHASGGTTPYLYNVGGSNQSSSSFSSLASGIYLVTVTDSNACTDTMSIDLSAPNAPIITSTIDTNVSCNGLNNGSIQIAGTGSTALTYTLNPGSITNTSGYFNNLAPNTYTITLSDASNCTVSTTVTITEPPILNIDSLTHTLPTCIPGNDGSIVVHTSGGTTPYLYNVGGPNQSSSSFSGLASNIYLVTVTDSNACMDTMSIDLSAPLPPVITSTLDTNVSCNGLNNGSIQIAGTGSSVLTYTLNPGSITNTSGYFNNLNPNTYTITLSDASNCTISTTVAITEPLILNIDSLTSALPTCLPGNDGSIVVHASGGTTPYLYNVGGSNQSSSSFSSLASGIYLVTVTDSNACTDTMNIDLSAPNAPIITSLVDTNVSCNGLNNGSIQIAGTGSTALTYTLNPGSVTNTSGHFNNLSPNTYTITLSDASNCTVSTTVTIAEPPILNIDSLTHTLPTCIPGNDGSIVVHASGGTTPYLYSVGGPNQSSNSFTSLASNIYLVTVTDSNACMDTMSIDLNAPLPPVITSTLDTNVSCNGLNNGSIQIAGTGSTALAYTLNPGSITNTSGYFNNLVPNTYTITLSDASNCTISTTVTITEPPVLNIDSLTYTLPTCLPGNDGSIVVHASGGTTPYLYNVGGSNQSSSSFSSLASGIYLVTVTDTNGCTDTMSIDLSAPNAPVITSVVDTNVSCNGLNNGSIQIAGTGSTALTYTLHPGSVTNTSGYFNNLVPNTYTITLSDASNCTISTTVVITEPLVLNIDSLTSVLPTCIPGNDGSIVVHASGGTTPYLYNVGGLNQSSSSFSSLASNIYLVTVTDSNACMDTMSIDLSAPPAPVITSLVDTNVSCNGLNNGSIQIAGTGSTALTYTLHPGSITNTSGYFSNLSPNTYTITLSDASNCTISTTVTITQPSVLNLDSLAGALPTCLPGNDGSIVVHASGGTTPYLYNVGGSNQSSSSFSSLASGIYLVTVTDTNGCTDTMSIDLSAPSAPVITSVVDTNVSCNGLNNGSIQISGTGSSVLLYSLSPGPASNGTGYFNNLAPNTYTITLSDISHCTISTTVTITEPPILNIDSLTHTLPTCIPGNDGSIVVHASGGTTPYLYNVGGSNQSSNSFTSLASNIYLVTVTDSNACMDTMSIDLSAPPAPVITSLVDTNVSCNGLNNGSIQIAGTGSSALTYTLNPGSVTNTSGYFNNLSPNTYTITLSDASNCTVSTTVTITEPSILNIDSLTSVLPTCLPGNDGSIIVHASGGTTPYLYNVGGSNQSSSSFSSLASGIYLVTVTDTNGCTDTMSIDLSAPSAPVITSVVDTNVSCNGLNNGSIQIVGTGSTALTYTLNPGSVTNTSGHFNNLAPNTYTITLSDASNCTVSTTVTITEPPVLNIDSLTHTLPTCIPGNDGSIIVHASGGTSPYQYSVGAPYQLSNSFSGLASNIYLVTVTDSNACTDTMSIDLSAPPAPVIISLVDTNVSCNGLNNGSIQISGTGSSALTYTLNPGSITNTSGYFNNLSPNTYTITLSDASNCTVSTTITITEPPILNIDSLTHTLPTCLPGNDGSIVVHASGGTIPYLYNVGGPNQSSNNFSSLASGIYLVTITDTNGCIDTMNIDLSAPSAPIITSTIDTNVSCNGLNNGSIQIVGTGSTALTYTLHPGSVTNTLGYFNNLAPNTYTITLSDASNCTVSTTVTITEPPILNIDSLTHTLPTCIPGNDGSIVVHASGGTTPYLYNVGGPNQSSNSFSGLASNIYLVTVTDSNACTDTMSIDLSAPPAPVIISLVDTNVSCNGLNNGSIQVSGTGSSALTYTLNPGSVTNTSGYFNNLAPNTYTITLSDASNCTVSTTITITEPPILNIDSLTHTLPTCLPGNDGSIGVHASGGTTPYLYNVGGPNQSSNNFSSLASGIYLVTVTDTNGCTDTMSIDLSAPSAPIITSTIDTNVSCNGLNNGSIQIAGTGSSALTYTLHPGSVTNTSGYFNNLSPNTYTITLSDASNCTVSTTVTITEPPILNIDSLTHTLPTCIPGNDGSIVVHASGGTTPYLYSVGGPNQSSNSFSGLASNIYLVTVTDSNACMDTMSIDLSAPPAPVITSLVDTNVSCNGLNNGSIQVSGTGSSALTYTLNPGSVTNTSGYFNNLAPNTYTITLSDASNCTVSTTVTISEPPILNIDSLTSILPSCVPGGDGGIIVHASGGTMPYQYNVGGPNQSSNSFSNLSAAYYLVTVVDTNGCTDTMSIILTTPAAPVITSTIDTNVSCNGLNNGSIQIAGTGSTALTYTLHPSSVTNTSGYFNNLAPNTYTITLSDASNCTVSTTVTITEPPVLNIDSLTHTLPTCIPGNDGSIVVHASGGTTPYLYNVGGSNQSSNSFSGLASNIYLVTVTDSNACMDTMSIDLSAPPAPVITSLVDTNVGCNGLNNGSLQVSGTGSSSLTYTLSPGNISNTTGYFNNLSPNTYTVTLSDASNCTISTTVTITQPPILNIDSLTSILPSCVPGGDGSIIVHASGGTMSYQYNIGGPNQSSNLFNNLSATSYLITLIDINGCTDTMSIILTTPVAPVITSTVDTNVNCNGANDGSIQILGTGSSAINYTLNPGNVSNATGYFNNLAPNTYTITLSDATNCTVSTTITITEPPVLNIDSITSTAPTCIPGGDGSIVVHASGGTSPYQYNLGGPNQLNNVFINLAANAYVVTVVDSNSCTDTMSITLSPPPPPVVTSLVDTNVSCNGLNNGSLQVSGTGSSSLTYTLSPGNISNTTGYFNNLSPNTYTITLSDASNCTTTTTVTISQPALLNIDSVVRSIPSCTPGGDGSIIVHVSGGTLPYLYSIGGPSQVSNTFNNLASNSYLITVTDSNNCIDTTLVDLNTPSGPIVTSVLDTNVSCNGFNNGSIQVNGSAVSAITYTLNPGNVSNGTGYFNNLVPNTYTITLSDVNNCTVSTTVNITEPLPLSWNPDTLTHVSCNGLTNGRIHITANGGTNPLTYTLQPTSVTNNTGVFTNLGPNIYTVIVSDANACTISTALAITEPSPLVIDSLSITHETCIPGTDGAILVHASGGTTTYQYNIGGGNQASNSFMNLIGGSYTVTVTDANNCSVTSLAIISTANAPVIDSISVTDASCNPGCDATAIIHASQGTSSAITYSINGSIYQNTNSFTNLCANSYTAYLQDVNGCTDTATFVISTASSPVIDSIQLTNTLCFGDSNATALILASGGSGTLTYSLTPTNQVNTNGSFTGLYASNYLISVVDTNGCQVDSNFTIIDAPSLQYTNVAVNDALCFNDSSGIITVTTSGGTGIITYTISPNPSANTIGVFNNLLGNTLYTIVATDANLCSVSTTAFVGEPSAVGDSNLQVGHVTCAGANDGHFSLLGTGGTPGYAYSVQPGNLSNTTGAFTGLAGNTYTVTITDANNCTHTTIVVVDEPSAVTIDSTSITNVSCFGLSDGNLFVRATGGVGGFNYNLQPNNITNATGLFANLTANTYTITATDANGCSVSTSLIVREPLPLVIDSLGITNVSCAGLSNGVITVFSSGGNGGNTYLLNPGAISNSTGIFTGLAANTYTVQVTDSLGCNVSAVDSVLEPLPITATYVTDSVSCNGGSDGQVQVTVAGGVPPYTTTLLPPNVTNTTGLFTGLTAGTYSVNILDSNGCPLTISNIEIEQPVPIEYGPISTVDITCFGDSTGEIAISATGGVGNISFTISPNIGVQSPAGNFTGLIATTYVITATDANNCTLTTSVTINQNPEIRIISYNYAEPRCHGDRDARMSFTAIGGVGQLLYSFNGAPYNSDTSYVGLSAGAYTLRVQDRLGCVLDTALVVTEPDPVGVGSYAITPTSCDGSEDGKIVVTATGGRPFYTYYRRPGISFNRNGLFPELKPGVYRITIVDSSGCKYDTSFNVFGSPNPLQTQITKTDLPCKGYGNEGSARVDVSGGTPPYTYLWSSTPASIQPEVRKLRFGFYFVEVVDAEGCKIVDTTYINPGECCTELFLPNAFSPNGDGQNDEFRIIGTAGVQLIQFEIFNRWGQKVWQTYNYTDSWDGTLKGEAQPISDYYYVFRYRCTTDGKEYIKKGNVTLIR